MKYANARLWIGDGLVQLEDLDRTLEESLIKSGAAMYVEV